MHRPHRGQVTVGGHHYGGDAGHLREQPRCSVEHLFDLAVRVVEEILHTLGLVAVEIGFLYRIDEGAVGLFGRHSASARVRLGEIALLVEVAQFVANRCGRHAEVSYLSNERRANGLGGLDIGLYNGAENRHLPVIQHHETGYKSCPLLARCH